MKNSNQYRYIITYFYDEDYASRHNYSYYDIDRIYPYGINAVNIKHMLDMFSSFDNDLKSIIRHLTEKEFNIVKRILKSPKEACMYLKYRGDEFIKSLSNMLIHHMNDNCIYELVEVSKDELYTTSYTRSK